MQLSILHYLRDLLSIVGFCVLLKEIAKYLLSVQQLRKIEKAYSSSLKFISEREEMRMALRRIPSEIIVEISKKGERELSPKVRTLFKMGIAKIKRKKSFVITVFQELDIHQQMAFVIREVFKEALSFDKILEIDLRDSLIDYYSYKFGRLSNIDKKVLEVLERKFQKSKFRELLIKLDSKELEEKITLNPPPEVRPILDRVIIPILELRENDLADIEDIATIETAKKEMRDLLEEIVREKIALLFIGRRGVNEYMQYLRERMSDFNGFLICSRGIYELACESVCNKFEELLKEKCKDYTREEFSGKLRLNEKEISYRYILLRVKDT